MRTGASQRTAWHLVGLLVLAVGSGGLAGCSGAHEPTQTLAPTTTKAAQAAPTTNLPALLGMSIDGLHSRLGPTQPLPVAFAGPDGLLGEGTDSAKQDSLATFRTGGLTLVASYNVHTRQVRDLILLGHHEDSLMMRAALRANASNYLLIPLFHSDRPGYLLGLRVVALD